MNRHWYVLDASTVPLGRLSTTAASLLMGKQKPNLAPHIDAGDYVVVINSDSLIITGNKTANKVYHRHSGFPSGLRQKTLGEVLAKNSSEIIRHAVRGMLPDNKLRKGRLARLKIYGSSDHPHQAQNPQSVTLVGSDKR